MNPYRVRFVPLGGVVGVTKNCYVYELWEGENIVDILIVDCGIGFPKEQQLGIDFVIPDVRYLEDKKHLIRGVCLTHGHEDHISALRFHYEKLGRPPVYASKLTSALVEAKFAEMRIKLKVNQIQYRKSYHLGRFDVEFVKMTHSIPDTTHLIIKTPAATLYHGSDYKLDITPPYGEMPDFFAMTRAGNEGITCLLSDCLGAEREGLAASESQVGSTFDDLMRTTRGKFIMTTFASNISRIRQCAEVAVKYNRQVVFVGRSMKQNTALSKELGYLNIPLKFLTEESEAIKHAPNKICIIITGSQGQYGSGLFKLANGAHPHLKVGEGDRIVFSSDPIPGNDDNIDEIIASLFHQGAEVVYPDIQDQLHASGHGSQEDMKYLIAFTKPRYLLPIGGDVRHQRAYLTLAKSMGYTADSVFLLNEGDTVWFFGGKAQRGEKVATESIFVDAYGIGDVGEVLLRDRATLGTEGMVNVIVITDSNGKMTIEPQISSKGFVHIKENKDLFDEAREKIRQSLKNKNLIESKIHVQRDVITLLEKYFSQATGRKPLISVDIIVI